MQKLLLGQQARLFIRLGAAYRGGDAVEAALDDGQVRKSKFQVHLADVAGDVDAAGRMGDGRVLEGAHHIQKRVHVGQFVKELAADAAFLDQAFNRGADVQVFYFRRHGLLGFEDAG